METTGSTVEDRGLHRQVRQGARTVGVASTPRVQVFVSRSLTAANGLSFSTVFRLLITEL